MGLKSVRLVTQPAIWAMKNLYQLSPPQTWQRSATGMACTAEVILHDDAGPSQLIGMWNVASTVSEDISFTPYKAQEP